MGRSEAGDRSRASDSWLEPSRRLKHLQEVF
jgi:hypothetical protein